MRKWGHSTIFLETGGNREVSWFRPLHGENPFSEVDWSENLDSQEDTFNDSQECKEEMNTVTNGNEDKEEKLQTLESLRDFVSNIVDKVEDRFEQDPVTYTCQNIC